MLSPCPSPRTRRVTIMATRAADTTRTPLYGLDPPVAKLFATSTAAAIVASAAASPLIAIVDKAITSNASGREPLWSCMKSGLRMLVKEPATFLRQPSFKWILGVYATTYLAANTTQLVCELKDTPWQYPKFLVTSGVNIAASVAKDRAFAKMFAKADAPTSRPFPLRSLGLFGLRDSLTIMASFNLPPLVTPWVESLGVSPSAARTAVQLTLPLAVQVISVPMHLNGLDLYNRPDATSAERVRFIGREYAKTLAARWARILPAYGIGGVINSEALAVMRRALDLPVHGR